jgi:hypothetical protein
VLGYLTGELQLIFCRGVPPRGGPLISFFTESPPNCSHHLNRHRRWRGWIVGCSVPRGEAAKGFFARETTEPDWVGLTHWTRLTGPSHSGHETYPGSTRLTWKLPSLLFFLDCHCPSSTVHQQFGRKTNLVTGS